MILNIGQHEFSIIWDGIYYYNLSNYPNVTDWELDRFRQFINYEKEHNRDTQIVCNNAQILEKVNATLIEENFIAQKPQIITECTACRQNGCLTEYLCHTASIKNAISIIQCGKILSAVKARNIPANLLVNEERNAAHDPADFFDYLMLSWGNCQAGDRLVMERKLQRDPTEEDLSTGFTPGIRFYFKYDVLKNHPNSTFDGYHALKIKDELNLNDYVYAIIIPQNNEKEFNYIMPAELKNRVYYIVNDCTDIWDWSEKVYNFISGL